MKLRDISQNNKELLSFLGDIPEEFSDPISADIMKDPVKLPSSNVIIDRNVIKQILLNDEHDPFNRSPLKINEVIEMPELKKKIDEWIRSKLKGKKKIENTIIEEEKNEEEIYFKKLE